MPVALNEEDMLVVGKIQELKNTTIARAKEYYRKKVNSLANPDVADRAQIIWDGFKRGDKVGAEAPEKETTMPKAKKVKAAKKEKAPKAEKVAKVDVPLPELDTEIELKPVDGLPYVFTALLGGKKHACVQASVDHGNGADSRFGYIGVSERRLSAVKAHAKENDLPVAVCATVRLKGRLDQGYAVPLEVFEKFKMESKHALTLGSEARAAYAKDGWAGVKFIEAKSEKKAA
jgi:hypothetical protein